MNTSLLYRLLHSFLQNWFVALLLLLGSSTIAVPPVWSAPTAPETNQTVPPFAAELYLVRIAAPAVVTRLTSNPAVDSLPVWSPDGKNIAFVSDRTGTPELFVMDATGNNVRQLTDKLLPTPDNGYLWEFGPPAWSPDGETIAVSMQWCFSCGGHAYYETHLFSISVVSGIATELPEQGVNPTWSPDGTKLLFEYPGDYTVQYRHFGVMNADGRDPFYLAELDSEQPKWSPDSSQLLFASSLVSDTEIYNSEIYKVNSDGSGLSNLTTSLAQEYAPQWSPDGSKIAFHRNKDTNSATDIFVMDADGGNSTALTSSPAHEHSPLWSPDGTMMAFFRYYDDAQCCTASIVVIKADGSHPQEIVSIWPTSTRLAWSPDGSRILFTNWDANTYTIRSSVIQATGGPITTLSRPRSDEYNTHAVWSPTSSKVAYVYADDVYVISFE